MDTIKQAYLTGERALFHASDVQVEDSTFAQGESPLKESRNIRLHNSIFKWKYPLWYSTDIECSHITLMETARSGIWYSEHVTIVFFRHRKHFADALISHLRMYSFPMLRKPSGIVPISGYSEYMLPGTILR